MPPRPRPRPRPAAAAQGSASASDTSSSIPTVAKTAGTSRGAELEAEDALFLRNRSTQAWKAIEKREKESQQQRPVRAPSADSDDAGEDPERTPVKRGRKPKSNGDRSNLPSLTNSKHLPMEVSDSSSEDEVVFAGEENVNNGGFSKGSSADVKGKGKRPRSRSRSITPPPSLPVSTLQNARSIVMRTLDANSGPRRPPSPTYTRPAADNSADLDLDPELARIAREVKSRPGVMARAASGSNQPTRAVSEAVGPEVVTVRVRWRPHPQDPDGREHAWSYQMRRNENFSSLFEQTADLASVLPGSLVMSYDNKRLFASATPHSLGIWAEVDLDASDQVTFDYLRANRIRARSPSVALSYEPAETHSSPPPSGPSSFPDEDDPPAQEKAEKFKLVIRSGAAKDLTIAVRPTTTCGLIVRAFVKAANLNVPVAKLAAARVVVDGDKMDNETEIGEADLEDGDMVEIAGL